MLHCTCMFQYRLYCTCMQISNNELYNVVFFTKLFCTDCLQNVIKPLQKIYL